MRPRAATSYSSAIAQTWIFASSFGSLCVLDEADVDAVRELRPKTFQSPRAEKYAILSECQ